MSKYSFPQLGNWQDFETFCRDFFELYWDAAWYGQFDRPTTWRPWRPAR